MTLPDVNVWLALTLSKHAHHRPARVWLDSMAHPASVVFCRATQQGLVRLLTTAAVLSPYGNPPLTNRAAWDIYASFISDERIVFAPEPGRLETTWRDLALRDAASPKLWMDAYLAAFAIEGALRCVTFDSGFQQFTGLDLLLLKPDHCQ